MAYRVVITKPGGPKVLDIQEISIPEPGLKKCALLFISLESILLIP